MTCGVANCLVRKASASHRRCWTGIGPFMDSERYREALVSPACRASACIIPRPPAAVSADDPRRRGDQ